MTRIAFGLIVAALGHCSEISAQDAPKSPSTASVEQLEKVKLTYTVVSAQGGTYGYDVFADGKRLIHQPTIPGQPGTLGFIKKSDAEKVAKLVIRKIKNKEVPPAITEQELRELKVID